MTCGNGPQASLKWRYITPFASLQYPLEVQCCSTIHCSMCFVLDKTMLAVSYHCNLSTLESSFHSLKVQKFSLLVSNSLSPLFLIPSFLKVSIISVVLQTSGIRPSFQSINHYPATAHPNPLNTPRVYFSKPNDCSPLSISKYYLTWSLTIWPEFLSSY